VLAFSVLQITMASPSIPNPGHGTSQLEGDGDLNMNSHKIINVLTPIASGDVATKGYADALGSGGGCAGGLCDSLPVGYDISYDWDGDGKTMAAGDCDETCPTCYKGSTTFTLSPDGKDQNCDGTVDTSETLSPSKTCNPISYQYSYVSKSVMESACSSYCTSQGSSFASVTCAGQTVTTNCWGNNMNWDTCASTGSGECGMVSQTVCVDSGNNVCNCAQVTRYR